MPRKNDRPLPGLDEWQVEILRLTVFRLTGTPDPVPDLWKDVVGEEPEARTSKPKTGERQELGNFADGKLILQIHPSRIDWIYVLGNDLELADAERKRFPEAMDRFSCAMSRWLEGRFPVQRIAFGAILRLPVQNLEAGYEQISEYLPFEVDPKTSSDFMYQINRKRDSKTIPHLKINRLSKWNVGMVLRQMLQPSISANPSNIDPTFYQLPEDRFCGVELDINTALDASTQLPGDQLVDLFEEMLELGREIVRDGDQP